VLLGPEHAWLHDPWSRAKNTRLAGDAAMRSAAEKKTEGGKKRKREKRNWLRRTEGIIPAAARNPRTWPSTEAHPGGRYRAREKLVRSQTPFRAAAGTKDTD